MGRWAKISLITFVAVVLCRQMIHSGWCNDESAHLAAGLYHWKTGRMDAYIVNPPLPRLIGSVPLLFDSPHVNWWTYLDKPTHRCEYAFAHQWISDNPETVRRHLILSRFCMLPFFFVGWWTVSRWAHELYGETAGLTAGAMWGLSPLVIANSAAVAPDLPAASTGILACYVFRKWLRQTGDEEQGLPEGRFRLPHGTWTLMVGISLALCVLCKFTWLFLYGLYPVVTVVHDMFHGRRTRIPSRLLALGGACVVSVVLVNMTYGWQGTGLQLKEYQFLSSSLRPADESDQETGNRFADSVVGELPVPFPREMVMGIDYLKWEFEEGMPSYLRGRWKEGGWWYFYLYAMAVKVPLGYLIAIIAGTLTFFAAQRRSGEWLVVLMPVIIVTLVSSQTGFTHHVRYVLPAFGFLFILASRVVLVLPAKVARRLTGLLLAGVVCYHLWFPGMAHAFFNPLAGGPSNGWRHLSFSNVDWGQSTYRMADWVRRHPKHRPVCVVFRSTLGSPGQLVEGPGISSRSGGMTTVGDGAGKQPQSGWYLVSSYQMTLEENRFFRDLRPAAQPYPDTLLFLVDGPATKGQN